MAELMSPQLKHYYENRDRILLSKRKYRDKNRLEINKRESQRARERRRENPEKIMLIAARRRAKILNLPFNLELEDIQIPDACPVLGVPLVSNFGGGTVSNNSPSLDKIIPELGYVKGNVCVISYKANRLKSDLTRDQLQRFLDYIDRKF